MNNNNIGKLILQFALLAFVLFTISSVFSGGGNVIGNISLVMAIVAFVVGFTNVKFAMILLFVSGAYLDTVKRLMTIDIGFSSLDIAYILILPVLIIAGMMTKLVGAWLIKPDQVDKRQMVSFIIITGLGLMMGGAYLLSSDAGLRGLGDAANASAYLYLIIIIPIYYKEKKDLYTLMKWLVVVYAPAGLWAIKQACWGIADFELAYLLSGYTNEIRQLDELVFRNMGTMVSAAALSMVASILAASLIIPIKWDSGKIALKVWLNPVRVVFVVIFVLSAYYTYSRTGWVCALIAIMGFALLQKKILAYTFSIFAVCGLFAIYLSADYLYTNKIVIELQDYIFEEIATSDEAKQALVVGTLEGRLESMREFTNNSNIWTPFGLRMAGLSTNEVLEGDQVHDVFTELLVKMGYIPLSILLLAGIFIFVRILNLNFSFQNRLDANSFRYFFALGGGMMLTGLSQGKMLFIFPTNLFWCLFFGMAFSIYRNRKVDNVTGDKAMSLSDI